jgi:hypothetical protein
MAILAAALVAANSALPLRAMQWLKIADGPANIAAANMVDAVNYTPNICLPANVGNLALEGEILFRTPRLLGGQAAKARMSCQSCHINGADNPNFHFPNASGAPGTADVSNSFFSAKGGNGSFDPVTIPDLSVAGKISRDRPKEVENFLANLIVTEFAGDVPNRDMLVALAAYNRALKTCAAGDIQRQPNLATDVKLVDNAMVFAGARLANNDPEMAYMLIAGARDIMGLIHERFVSENLSGQRAELQRLSVAARDIGRIENADKRQKAITLWRDEFSKLSSILRDKEALSLYNRAELAKAVSS